MMNAVGYCKAVDFEFFLSVRVKDPTLCRLADSGL
jgi:hypothetical protein